jgi:hypothetical protein
MIAFMIDDGIRARLRGAGAYWANARRRAPGDVRRDACDRLTDVLYLARLEGVSVDAMATETGLTRTEVGLLLRSRRAPGTPVPRG